MEINYISIYDANPAARYLFVSESVEDVLGYTPDELVGRCGYELTHPDERPALRKIHYANIEEERLSSLTSCRILHKDGHWVLCDVVVHFCYNLIVCTNFAIISTDHIKHKMRIHSADEVWAVRPDGKLMSGAWNNSQDKIKAALVQKFPWGPNQRPLTDQDPRFCLVINRYTSESTIVFATPMCQVIVGLDPFDCIGRSLLDYVAPDDRLFVTNQIELSKSSDMIRKVKFNWIKTENEMAHVEAVISCTYDGMVMVARLMEPTTIH